MDPRGDLGLRDDFLRHPADMEGALARWMPSTTEHKESIVSLSRKRKKELRRLQEDAAKLWESQQAVAGHAAQVARAAGRQLGQVTREEVLPAVQSGYERHVVPAVDRGMRFTRNVVDKQIVPAVGSVIGSALSAWDVANDKRRTVKWLPGYVEPTPAKRGPSVGSVIAVILGVAAALGAIYAAWQTLRTDDELWVADDPLAGPHA